MGLAVLIITVGPVVSRVQLVVVIYARDVVLGCLYSDMFDSETSVCIKHCWIDWCERYALLIWLWFDRWVNFLEIGVLRIVDKLLPVIIFLVMARMVMGGGFATASAQVVFTIGVREVAGGGGLVFLHIWYKRGYGEVVASESVRRNR